MRNPRFLAALAVATALTMHSGAHAADKLPTSFKVDATQTSVSGLSSGAYMAVQLQVAYSSRIVGAGVVAGGPYYCAAGSALNSAACMGFSILPLMPSLMVQAAQNLASDGKIDALSHLASRKVYLYSGTKDTVVLTPAVKAAVDFFKGAGVPTANIKYEGSVPSGHALITPSAGNTCGANASPYVSHCTVGGKGYDQAGTLLGHIYGTLQPKAASAGGQLLSFDQTTYASKDALMAPEGYLYVPKACAAGEPCKVHVALHGCSQSAASVGTTFVGNAGYNAWADSNHLLVLYPQVNASFPGNMMGCWDWFGYTGANYATREAPQMKAILGMVQALGSTPAP